MRRLAAFIMVLCALVFARTGTSELEGVPTVAYLSRVSNVIVVGRAVLENIDGSSATLSIEVDRVIQGEVTPDTQIRVVVVSTSSSCTIPSSAKPITAIWFLTQETGGTFRFANSPKSQSCHPFESNYETPGGPLPTEWTYPETAKPQDKLAHEIAWAIASHPEGSPAANVIKSDNLDGVSNESRADIYHKLYLSNVADAHFTGLLGLVKQGDVSVLDEVMGNMAQFAEAPITDSYTLNGQRISAIKNANGNTATQIGPIAASIDQIVNPDATTVGALGNLLQMQNAPQSVRYAAAHALANIHTGTAVAYLAPLLNSDDPQLRADAIGGIACFANGVPVIDPTKPGGGIDLNRDSPFKTDATLSHFAMGTPTISQKESYYLNYWQAWWFTHGSQALATPSPVE
ncbi:MAG: HEAT repeat domain-containing protein [Acidobacteriaceae bacterium]